MSVLFNSPSWPKSNPETRERRMVKKEKRTVMSMEEIPDCHYPEDPTLVKPNITTKRHTLYLSNLDDQKFLRFSIKYLYVYRKSVDVKVLQASLARALVEYYPLAGRLRICEGEHDHDEKLEVDCNGEGALFAEGSVDMSVDEFLVGVGKPNRSWRKLLFRIEGQSFVGLPPLVLQVTHLSCGGMILCMAVNHSICDGIGTSRFLQAWAHFTVKPDADVHDLAFHCREMLRPRSPPTVTGSHPEFNVADNGDLGFDVVKWVLSQPLVPVSVTFTSSDVLCLKQRCAPSLKCTSFEALASHVWRVWIRSLSLPSKVRVKLLFSVNVRNRLRPQLPDGFYGNGFVLACAETTVENLSTTNLRHTVELVQDAKKQLDDEYLRSMIDLLEQRRSAKPDLTASLVISQWSKLGLEDLDFGGGKPVHMGPLASEIYCLFLPVVGDLHSYTVLLSVPEILAGEVEHGLKDVIDGVVMEEDGGFSVNK